MGKSIQTKITHKCDTKAVKWFGFPDMHIPDHDHEAVEVALAAHREFKPDCTIIGNDMLNCTVFARHPKQTIEDGAIVDFKATEIDPANEFIDKVQKHTGFTYFLEGNHDAWLERWTVANGQEAIALHSLTSVKINLSRDRTDFHYIRQVSDKNDRTSCVILHPKLICVHGWSCAIHAAHQHLMLSPLQSVIFNHTHRRQEKTLVYPTANMPTTATSAGCLCNRVPMWRHTGSPTRWIHGFWVAYVGRQSFTVYTVLINKGRAILPNGKEIKVV